MAIKILRKGLPRLGIVKVGRLNYERPFKGRDGVTHYPPIKDDHFTVYTTERDADGRPVVDEELMRELGAKPTELDVVLPFDDHDLCFRTELAYYRGGTRFCHGDGEAGFRLEEKGKQNGGPVYGERKPHNPCGEGCPDLKSRRCKPSGVLSFLLREQAFVGGVFEFRSHGWRSVANIEESIKAIRLVTGGLLAWIPLKLKVQIETVQPKDGGAAQKAPIVRLYYPGPPAALLGEAKKRLELQAPLHAEVKRLEAGLREAPPSEPTRAEAVEIEEEFYPDAGVEQTADAPITAAFDIGPPERASEQGDGADEPVDSYEEPPVAGIDYGTADDSPPLDSYDEPPTGDSEPEPPPLNLISEKQRKRLYAIAKEGKVNQNDRRRLIQAYGFGSSSEITRDAYDEIVGFVTRGPKAVNDRAKELEGGELPLG